MTDIIIYGGQSTDTFLLTSSDSVQRIPSANLESSDGRLAMQAKITLENNSIRYAFNTKPIQTGASRLGHALLFGQEVILRGYTQIKLFRFINRNVGLNANIMISLSHFSNIKAAHKFKSIGRQKKFKSNVGQNKGVRQVV